MSQPYGPGLFDMRDDQLFQELKNLAEKLDVTVAEHSFKNAGIAVKSGFCLVKDRKHCILDKNLRLAKKIRILVKTLAGMPHEDIFVVPAIRELLGAYADKGREKGGSGTADEPAIHPDK